MQGRQHTLSPCLLRHRPVANLLRLRLQERERRGEEHPELRVGAIMIVDTSPSLYYRPHLRLSWVFTYLIIYFDYYITV